MAGRQTPRRRPGWAEPEVVFRIVHVADAGGRAPAGYRDQAVEVALGPNPAFATGHIGSFTRRVPADRVVTGAPRRNGTPKRAREPKTPRVAELLRKALAWRALLESGQVANQAEIARREGVSRARVTQVMGLVRLAPEIQQRVLSLPDATRRPAITEQTLRPISKLPQEMAQLHAFQLLLTHSDAAGPGCSP